MHTDSSPTRIGLKLEHCWIKVDSNGNKKSIHWESNRWINITQEKSLKFHEWERYGYPHLFYMNWEKIFRYIGESMETNFPYLGFVSVFKFNRVLLKAHSMGMY